MSSPPLRPSANLLKRTRSGGVIVDTRTLPTEAFEDLRVINTLSEALGAFGPVRGIRAWVLGDGAARWTLDPALAWSGLYGLWALSQPSEEDDPGTKVVAILAAEARSSAVLARLLRCMAFPCYPTRRAGGIPIEDHFIGGSWQTSLTIPPLGELPDPPLLARLAEARAALPEEDDAGAAVLDAMAMDWIVGSTGERSTGEQG